jgi:hypothetical protein
MNINAAEFRLREVDCTARRSIAGFASQRGWETLVELGPSGGTQFCYDCDFQLHFENCFGFITCYF